MTTTSLIDAIADWLSGLRVFEPDAPAPSEADGRHERFDPSRCPLEEFN
jgi:hypothetical protein